ncbi:MAG: hypothetical protein ABSD56_10690 [Bryobacteraceae bacterium]|jgi:hypothetical protein
MNPAYDLPLLIAYTSRLFHRTLTAAEIEAVRIIYVGLLTSTQIGKG